MDLHGNIYIAPGIFEKFIYSVASNSTHSLGALHLINLTNQAQIPTEYQHPMNRKQLEEIDKTNINENTTVLEKPGTQSALEKPGTSAHYLALYRIDLRQQLFDQFYIDHYLLNVVMLAITTNRCTFF